MEFLGLQRDGLIMAEVVSAAGEDPRVLRDAAARGLLVRVRRGAYVLADTWAASTSAQRHLLVARAALVAKPASLLAGRSAAAVWELPGRAGEAEPVTLLVRDAVGPRSGLRMTSVGVDRAQAIRLDGFRVTTLARTACDVARHSDYATAVIVLDSALWRRRRPHALLEELEAELAAAVDAGERRTSQLRRAIGFSTHLSDSPGESLARLAIHRLGFTPPVLQQRFVDVDGEMFPDFWWPEVDVAAEFDGKMKYTRRRFTQGDPSDVVWREKRREDRLRRQVRSVERITTSDVADPSRLRRILSDAGVPLRARRARTRAHAAR